MVHIKIINQKHEHTQRMFRLERAFAHGQSLTVTVLCKFQTTNHHNRTKCSFTQKSQNKIKPKMKRKVEALASNEKTTYPIYTKTELIRVRGLIGKSQTIKKEENCWRKRIGYIYDLYIRVKEEACYLLGFVSDSNTKSNTCNPSLCISLLWDYAYCKQTLSGSASPISSWKRRRFA